MTTQALQLTLPPDAAAQLNQLAADNSTTPEVLADALLLDALTRQDRIDSALDAIRNDQLRSQADLQQRGY